MLEEFAQIFDNLVGGSKEELVRTLSKTGAKVWDRVKTLSVLIDSNESLIPAQNQRWRRA